MLYFLICRNLSESLQRTCKVSICVFAIALNCQRELKNGNVSLRLFMSVLLCFPFLSLTIAFFWVFFDCQVLWLVIFCLLKLLS